MPRPDLGRLLRPQSVAIVGASEKRTRSNHVVHSLLESTAQVHLVNPNQPLAYGQKTFPTLQAIGTPVDAVFVMVNAALAIPVVREAARAGCGGAIVNAGGFRETGDAGERLQSALVEAAGTMPILGPNCNGYIDANAQLRLSGAPPLPLRAGSIGVVTHSGALIGSMGVAGHVRRVGFSHLISTGNEATVDMTDCLEFLIDDPATKVVCLIVETIRRPAQFLSAVRRATQAGKPVIALKLGSSERGRAIARSHTGAIAEDSWVYECVFRQHGIASAADLTELVDRAVLFDQLAPERWSALEGLAVVSPSGGGAGLAGDLCARFGVELPVLEDVATQIRALIPAVTLANPVDLTGFIVGNEALAREALGCYVNSAAVDTVLLQWFLDDAGREMGEAFLQPFEALAAQTQKTLMLGSLDDGYVGDWTAELPAKGIAVGRGLPATLRALDTMGAFVRRRRRTAEPVGGPILELARPSKDDVVRSEAGPILGFASSMHLLRQAGVAVVPFRLLAEQDRSVDVPAEFGDRLVIKLADVAHRTDIGAVRVGIARADVPRVIAELRGLAAERGLPGSVVIQPLVEVEGEAFVGINGESGFGPIVLCGVGGIFVEVLKRVAGAVAPLRPADAQDMLEELASAQVFQSVRGRRPWNRAELCGVLMAASRIAVAAAPWLASLDINPLVWTGSRFMAVDALFLCKDN